MSRAIQTTIALAQRILDRGATGNNGDQKPLLHCFAAVLDGIEAQGHGNAQIAALVDRVRETLSVPRTVPPRR